MPGEFAAGIGSGEPQCLEIKEQGGGIIAAVLMGPPWTLPKLR